MTRSLSHLAWVPAAAALGFAVSFVFGDRLVLPVDLYYAIYVSAVGGFLWLYRRRTGLDLRLWLSRRLVGAIVLGLAGGLVLVRGVLAQPETEPLAGLMLWWAILWRGVVYGAVDGLLLLAFPWVVVWRALGAERAGWGRKVLAALLSWVAILLVTTVYHLGYEDFRSTKIVQPNLGSTLAAAPTLVSANPIASPISHVFLHVAAVLHSPETELFLPPHRRRGRGEAPIDID